MTENSSVGAPAHPSPAPDVPAETAGAGLRRYRVLDATGRIAGRRVEKGKTIELTAEAAKYHLPPYGAQLELVETASKKR